MGYVARVDFKTLVGKQFGRRSSHDVKLFGRGAKHLQLGSQGYF